VRDQGSLELLFGKCLILLGICPFNCSFLKQEQGAVADRHTGSLGWSLPTAWKSVAWWTQLWLGCWSARWPRQSTGKHCLRLWLLWCLRCWLLDILHNTLLIWKIVYLLRQMWKGCFYSYLDL